jgi:hypothetical protein
MQVLLVRVYIDRTPSKAEEDSLEARSLEIKTPADELTAAKKEIYEVYIPLTYQGWAFPTSSTHFVSSHAQKSRLYSNHHLRSKSIDCWSSNTFMLHPQMTSLNGVGRMLSHSLMVVGIR